MSLPYLPNELWNMILDNLDVDDKISCRKVCIKFYNLLDDIEKLLYEKFGSPSGILMFALTNKKMIFLVYINYLNSKGHVEKFWYLSKIEFPVIVMKYSIYNQYGSV